MGLSGTPLNLFVSHLLSLLTVLLQTLVETKALVILAHLNLSQLNLPMTQKTNGQTLTTVMISPPVISLLDL